MKTPKDFDRWNEVKKKTHAEQPRLYTVREIWWCRLGVNIGTEQDGSGDWYVRPVARANLSQIRVIDTRRLEQKIGFLGKEIFMKLRKAAKDLL